MSPSYGAVHHMEIFTELAEAIGELAVTKVAEMHLARKRRRRRRVGKTLRPGAGTPLWNGLRREVGSMIKRRGDQVKLARILGLPRQRVNSFLTSGSEMPDAERTLQMLAWMSAMKQNRPPG